MESIIQTPLRPQIKNLDKLPFLDRSLIDYEKYHHFVGHAGVQHSMAIQATRGCPYKCFYCDIYKTAPVHIRRSPEHLFSEVRQLAEIGIKRFEFIDDIFNFNRKAFNVFFENVLKYSLKVNFYFPTGLRGDLLNKEMIDLMVEAGAIGINLSLEHAAPRLQKVMKKNLNVDLLHDNLSYIAGTYPHVALVLNAMHGFPTETEDEASQTLDFVKSIRWLHFPYLHKVRIFPGTELERFAIENGVAPELIKQSQDMSFHEFSPTLPFSRDFTNSIVTSFLREYVLNRERLLHILPYQLKYFSEEELNQKYNSYFPTKIKTIDDLLKIVKIDRKDIFPAEAFNETNVKVDNLNVRLNSLYLPKPSQPDALKLLFIDFSNYFTKEGIASEYNVVEPPLGLLALQSYLNKIFAGKISGKILKSRIDFDSFDEMTDQIAAFSPDLIGVRSMDFYKSLFHDGIGVIRASSPTTPIIAGGPYPTASPEQVLQDDNIDLVVVGEGEETLEELIDLSLKNKNRLPELSVLTEVKGLVIRENGSQ